MSKNTIIKDVGVFLNTYLSPIKGDRDFKDLLSGLLIDLGLVERIDKVAPGGSAWFRVTNTAKEDIPVEVLFFLSRNNDDRVAQRELKEMLSHLGNELNRRILSSLYTNIGNVAWLFQGEKEAISTRKNFYRLLSRISETLYSKTPIYRNELINRHKLSSNIPLARKNLINQLVEKWEEKELGFSPDHYPPEKTIYLTLLKDTKIHREDEEDYMTLSAPQEPSFMPLWQECENFLENTKKARKSAADLIDILSKRPFKLKQGFLEFWVPVFLFIKRYKRTCDSIS